jgi:AcrR family transcriptional regulator
MPRVTEAHLEARKQQILEATFRCLSKKGYSRTTIRDIAAEAGLSLGTLYLYFRNKEEIVRALSEWSRERSDARLEESFPEGPSLDIICTIFEQVMLKYNNLESADALRVDLQIWSESISNAELQAAFVAGVGDRIAKLSRLIAQAQEEGSISADIDVRAAARVFMAIFIGLEVQKVMEPECDIEKLLPVVMSLLRGSFVNESAGGPAETSDSMRGKAKKKKRKKGKKARAKR